MIRLNLVIGCTASGKSAVGLELARRWTGQIVSVDSMKIYRRMDVGTAKPSTEARRQIPHHLIDIVEPSEAFSLGRYIEHAQQVFSELSAAGVPFVAVGGTMLYVRSLLGGVFEGPSADLQLRAAIRERAAREGTAVLHAELSRIDPAAGQRIHPNDLRRIERALEVYQLTGQPISVLQTQWEQASPHYDCHVVALRRPREEENRRINARVMRMVEAGLLDEVRSLLAEPAGLSDQAAQAVGYAEIIAHLRGRWSLEQAIERIKINTRQFAKSQRTWMRRIPGVKWVDVTPDDTVATVADRVEREME